MLVVKRTSFDAAHFLPKYEGKCKNMHGHRWTVELGVEGPVNPWTGMVVDFTELKYFLKVKVVEVFDHKVVNDVVENPTAENIVAYIGEAWENWLRKGYQELALVRVWETEDSYAEWRP